MNAHVDDAAAAPVGVRGHDGAVDVEIELAVRRRTEWRRHAVALGPRVQRDGCDREGDEERGKQAEASDGGIDQARGLSVVVFTGSHLPGLSQTGRCRVVDVRSRTRSR